MKSRRGCNAPRDPSWRIRRFACAPGDEFKAWYGNRRSSPAGLLCLGEKQGSAKRALPPQWSGDMNEHERYIRDFKLLDGMSYWGRAISLHATAICRAAQPASPDLRHDCGRGAATLALALGDGRHHSGHDRRGRRWPPWRPAPVAGYPRLQHGGAAGGPWSPPIPSGPRERLHHRVANALDAWRPYLPILMPAWR